MTANKYQVDIHFYKQDYNDELTGTESYIVKGKDSDSAIRKCLDKFRKGWYTPKRIFKVEVEETKLTVIA